MKRTSPTSTSFSTSNGSVNVKGKITFHRTFNVSRTATLCPSRLEHGILSLGAVV
jgi:hypothetical protein